MMKSIALLAASRRPLLVACMLLAGAAMARAQQASADSAKRPATKTVPPPATKQVTPAPTQTKPAAPQTKTVTPPPTQTKAASPQAKTATPPPTQTKTAAPQTKPVTPPAGQTKAVTPPPQGKATPASAGRGAAAPQRGATPPAGRGGRGLNVVTSDTAAARPIVMMREVFEYDRDGRRDPFLSLLATTDLRPTLGDLKLLMTVVDEPGRSIALVSDAYDGKQKTIRVGTRLGRMRVSSIRADVVVFTIEEFGMNRRDSLLLRDSTKVRGR